MMTKQSPKMLLTAWVLGGETLGVISADGELTLVDYIQVGIDRFADLAGQPLAFSPVTTKVQAVPALLQRRNNMALAMGSRVSFVGRWQEIRAIQNPTRLNALRRVYRESKRRVKEMVIVWTEEHLQTYLQYSALLLKQADEYATGKLSQAQLLVQQTKALATAPSWAQEAMHVFQTKDEHKAWRGFDAMLDRIAPRQYVITGVSRVKWLYYSNPLARFVHFVDPEQMTDPNYQHQMVMALDKQRREREERGLPIIDEQYLKVKKYPTGLWSSETAQSSIIPPVRRKKHGTRGLPRRRQRHPENRRQGRTG